MMRRKNRARSKKNWAKTIFLTLLIVVFGWILFSAGQKLIGWFVDSWDGSRQLSLALETKDKDILILTLTPAKKMMAVILVPNNLEIETPWFGKYQAGRLSLLAEQENNQEVFSRSLSYFLGVPVDFGIINTNFRPKGGEFSLKENIASFFFPPKSARYFKVWRFLNSRDLFWRTIYLSEFSQEKELPDGSSVLVLNHDQMANLADYFTDPLVKQEALPISVFNIGSKTGLAQKAAIMIGNMGGTVVAIGNTDKEIDEDCLIVVSSEQMEQSLTLSRIKNVLGCSIIKDAADPSSAQILIKNVKI